MLLLCLVAQWNPPPTSQVPCLKALRFLLSDFAWAQHCHIICAIPNPPIVINSIPPIILPSTLLATFPDFVGGEKHLTNSAPPFDIQPIPKSQFQIPSLVFASINLGLDWLLSLLIDSIGKTTTRLDCLWKKCLLIVGLIDDCGRNDQTNFDPENE